MAGILANAALFGSKVLKTPFDVIPKMNQSGTLIGEVGHSTAAGLIGTIGQGYMKLEPRGLAKLAIPFFEKAMAATERSAEIATRNKTVFWDNAEDASTAMGLVVASPGAYYYLHQNGVEAPTRDAIKAVLQTGLFKFPPGEAVTAFMNEQAAAQQGAAQQAPPTGDGAAAAAAAAAGAEAAQQSTPPPTGGAEAAAEGAGQAA
jgi:hypothetical protein